MVSKNSIKLIRSLINKNARDLTGLFVVEGEKTCSDLLKSEYQVETVYFTEDWGLNNQQFIESKDRMVEFIAVSEEELHKISLLTTPNKVLAVAVQKKTIFSWSRISAGPIILLDQVQDPGNLGTIIRTADWFGFQTIIGSPGTADIYNPKVIQAAMGSSFRVDYYKYDLEILLKENLAMQNRPVYAAVLSGKNIYNYHLIKNGFYLFGNEAKGIELNIQSLATELITIPNNSLLTGKNSADSLNIGIAAAIVMAEFNRQNNP